MTDDAQTAEMNPAPQFIATLLPQRSLSRKGFVALMVGIAAISIACGVAFVAVGAWPVTGFFGFDVFLVYLAFRLNYRAARLTETVELTGTSLTVTRKSPSGRVEHFSFNPYWVRFDFTPGDETTAGVLSLSSHGKKLVFGTFLSSEEKTAFAKALRGALTLNR